MTEVYEIYEKEVAEVCGIDRKILKKLRRQLLESVDDFGRIGNKIAYTKKGVQMIMDALGVEAQQLWDRVIKTAPGPALPSSSQNYPATSDVQLLLPPHKLIEKEVTVSKIYAKNHGYLEANLEGKTVRVRVRSNKNFLPGMKMTVHLVQFPDLYSFRGRCPRSRGRW